MELFHAGEKRNKGYRHKETTPLRGQVSPFRISLSFCT
jgi:hypothetical protein